MAASPPVSETIAADAIVSQRIAIDENGDEVLVTVFDIATVEQSRSSLAATRAATIVFDGYTHLSTSASSTLVYSQAPPPGALVSFIVNCYNFGNSSSRAGALSFNCDGVVQDVNAGQGVQFSKSAKYNFNVLAKALWWDDSYRVTVVSVST